MRTIVSAAVVAVLVLAPAGSTAQWANIPPPSVPLDSGGRPDLSAPAPRLPDGTPDLSGIWMPPFGYLRDLARDLDAGAVPFQPWAKAVYDERVTGAHWKEEPDANCLPQGVPKVLLAPAPWRVVQTPGVTFFIHEAFNLWWQTFTDGRVFVPHEDVSPTWHGYSTARWEGDTLIVDNRGFNGKLWLDQMGKPSTESLHVTTRFHRTSVGSMTLQITIDDPGAYTRPWTVDVEVRLLPDTQLMEFICLENERNVRGHQQP